MKFYYFYIPSDLALSGGMMLVFFIIISLYLLLIIINFRFRVNRTKNKSKNSDKPLLYTIPNHIEHSEKYVDPIEYMALKSIIFNERDGHVMKAGKQLYTSTERRKRALEMNKENFNLGNSRRFEAGYLKEYGSRKSLREASGGRNRGLSARSNVVGSERSARLSSRVVGGGGRLGLSDGFVESGEGVGGSQGAWSGAEVGGGGTGGKINRLYGMSYKALKRVKNK